MLKEHISIDVKKAHKTKILDRIRFFNAVIASGRLSILRHCKNVVDALLQAVWDDDKLCDVRLDDGRRNVDSLDALEYAAEPYMKEIIGSF